MSTPQPEKKELNVSNPKDCPDILLSLSDKANQKGAFSISDAFTNCICIQNIVKKFNADEERIKELEQRVKELELASKAKTL